MASLNVFPFTTAHNVIVRRVRQSHEVVGKVGRGGVRDAPVEEFEQVELHLLELFPGVVVGQVAQLGQVLHALHCWQVLVCFLKLGCMCVRWCGDVTGMMNSKPTRDEVRVEANRLYFYAYDNKGVRLVGARLK